MTLLEIIAELKLKDEVDLLELLHIDSEMLVERFIDLVEDRADIIERDL